MEKMKEKTDNEKRSEKQGKNRCINSMGQGEGVKEETCLSCNKGLEKKRSNDSNITKEKMNIIQKKRKHDKKKIT